MLSGETRRSGAISDQKLAIGTKAMLTSESFLKASDQYDNCVIFTNNRYYMIDHLWFGV